MKKAISTLLIVAMLLSAAATLTFSAWSDEAQKPTVNATSGTPTVDGVVDDIWAKASVQEVKNPSIKTTTSTVQFRTLYDSKNMYYLFEVLDSTPTSEEFDAKSTNLSGGSGAGFIWKDSIMLVMTIPTASQTAGAERDLGFQAVITSYGRVLHQSYTVPQGVTKEGITARSTLRKDADEKQIGFYLEVQIPLANDWRASMAKDTQFLAAVNYNDNFGPDSTTRNAALAWSDKDGNAWTKPEQRGVIKLADGTTTPVDPPSPPAPAATLDTTRPVAYAAKGTPTIDGTIDAVWGTTKLNRYTAESIKPAGNYAEYPVCQPSFRVLWDDESVYFLFVVVDTSMGPAATWEDGALGGNLWKRDSVMLSFDLDYSREVTTGAVKSSYDFQMIISAYGNTANFQEIPKSVFIETGEGESAVKNYAISYVNYKNDEYHCAGEGEYPGAYIIEMKMNPKDYYPGLEMKENNFIGFYSIVNDNFAVEAEAGRNYQTTWFDETGKGWNNRSEQGSILFVNTVEEPDGLTDIVLIDADQLFGKTGDQDTEPEDPGTQTPPPTSEDPGSATAKPPVSENQTNGTDSSNAPAEAGCASAVSGSAIAFVSLLMLGFAVAGKARKDENT